MEYTFISRNTLDQIIEKYNTSLYDKNLRSWAKDKFILEEIVPEDYRVLVKATNNPILIVEKFYDVLCHIHSEITQHSGQRQTWNSIHERWEYIKQSIYRLHKKTPYKLVYGDKPQGNCTLVNELYTNNIFNKKEIPDTIKISNADYEIDLDDNMIDFSLDNINDQEQSPDGTICSVSSPNNNIGCSVSSPTSPVLLSRSIVSSLGSPVQLYNNDEKGRIINSEPVSSSNNNILLLSNNCGLVSSPNNYGFVSSPNNCNLMSLPNNCGLVSSPQNAMSLHDNN
ncbi:30815_t:CDS:2, partial [Gigaspora margarita]